MVKKGVVPDAKPVEEKQFQLFRTGVTGVTLEDRDELDCYPMHLQIRHVAGVEKTEAEIKRMWEYNRMMGKGLPCGMLYPK